MWCTDIHADKAPMQTVMKKKTENKYLLFPTRQPLTLKYRIKLFWAYEEKEGRGEGHDCLSTRWWGFHPDRVYQ